MELFHNYVISNQPSRQNIIFVSIEKRSGNESWYEINNININIQSNECFQMTIHCNTLRKQFQKTIANLMRLHDDNWDKWKFELKSNETIETTNYQSVQSVVCEFQSINQLSSCWTHLNLWYICWSIIPFK
jgi:hypothetical protein